MYHEISTTLAGMMAEKLTGRSWEVQVSPQLAGQIYVIRLRFLQFRHAHGRRRRRRLNLDGEGYQFLGYIALLRHILQVFKWCQLKITTPLTFRPTRSSTSRCWKSFSGASGTSHLGAVRRRSDNVSRRKELIVATEHPREVSV